MSNPRCWLHPDTQLTLATGVSFHLRFIGTVPVLVSIKSVNLEMRTLIAHAAIHQAIANTGLQTSRPHRVSKSVSSFLGPETNRQFSLIDVRLTVTSRALFVETLDLSQLLFKHDLSTVSFASGGDAETANFVCYVSKSASDDRACYVFDCFDSQAQEVIITLGQAFQLGFQEFKQKQGHLRASTNGSSQNSTVLTDDSHGLTRSLKSSDSVQRTNAGQFTGYPNDSLSSPKSPDDVHNEGISDADAETDEDTWLMDVPLIPSAPARAHGHAFGEHFNYVNVPSDAQDTSGPVSNRPNPPGLTSSSSLAQASTVPQPGIQQTDRFRQLEPVGEPWYVGQMSRAEAEQLLRYEGDFLVRASPHQPGQFVLSGLQDNKCRHLLLADPSGQVRTKDRVFDSIQHLVDYHVQNGIPIRSTDSEIRLIFPVSTSTLCEEL